MPSVSTARVRLAHPGWLMLSLVGVLLVLWILYPEHELLDQVKYQNDSLTINYLKNLIRVYPHNNKIRLTLVRHLLKQHAYPEAAQQLRVIKTTTKPEFRQDLAWYDYLVERGHVYSLPKDSLAWQQAASHLQSVLDQLAKKRLTPLQMKVLARHASAFNRNELALNLYERCAQHVGYMEQRDFAEAGRLALAERQYVLASHYYFKAKNASLDLASRRHYFLSAMKSLQAGGQLEYALQVSSQQLGDLLQDRETLLYLINLAKQANRGDKAVAYTDVLLKHVKRQ